MRPSTYPAVEGKVVVHDKNITLALIYSLSYLVKTSLYLRVVVSSSSVGFCL